MFKILENSRKHILCNPDQKSSTRDQNLKKEGWAHSHSVTKMFLRLFFVYDILNLRRTIRKIIFKI